MLFTTPVFLFIFLPVFIAVYSLSPRNLHGKNFIALIASLLFFSWSEPVFVFVLFASIFVDYRVSVIVSPNSEFSPSTKRWALGAAITLATLMLIVSKYLDFIVNIINDLSGNGLRFHIEQPHIPLLLGISFITFHRISYLVDSYKGRAVPPRGFFDCALYIFLFPQLIAGPIIRYHDIGYQIQERSHTAEDFLLGFYRFSIGLAKKLVFADPLGLIADKVFATPPAGLPCLFAWGGILAYTLQIYFDFSGYSDMAIGLGRMMGFRFPENFNRPYISRSITEFWQRWHISLSNWMRLYLYIPLGGNRVSVPRMYLNLWIVFLLSGFWHGASWNFVAWGAYYGFFLSLERALSSSPLARLVVPGILRQLVTLLLVMVGWVFFRSTSIGHALQYLSVMFDFSSLYAAQPPWGMIFDSRGLVTMLAAVLVACVRLPEQVRLCPAALRVAWTHSSDGSTAALSLQFTVTLVLLVASAAMIVSADYVPFLYFRF